MDAISQFVWTSKFIKEIENRPGLWDETIKSRDVQKQLWEELSELYNNKTVDSLKRKFNKLKARFRQELSAIPQTDNKYDIEPRLFESNWLHYEQMLFLSNEIEIKKPQPEKRKSTSVEDNETAKKKCDEDDVVSENDNDWNISSMSDQTKKPVKGDVTTEIEVKPDIFPNPPTDDALYHFLMGLYGCMSELDPIRRINVQARIYVMLSQEMEAAAAAAANN